MSRIGRMPITVPANVTVTIAADNTVTVKGPLGTLTEKFNERMAIKLENGELTVTRPTDEKEDRSVHGLSAKFRTDQKKANQKQNKIQDQCNGRNRKWNKIADDKSKYKKERRKLMDKVLKYKEQNLYGRKNDRIIISMLRFVPGLYVCAYSVYDKLRKKKLDPEQNI